MPESTPLQWLAKLFEPLRLGVLALNWGWKMLRALQKLQRSYLMPKSVPLWWPAKLSEPLGLGVLALN